MKLFSNFRSIKYLLILVAAVIAAGSLFISDKLVADLKNEELNKMRVWAEAMRSLNSADESTDLNLVLAVLNGNNTIPVVVIDSKGAINSYRNIEIESGSDSLAVLMQMASEMRGNSNIIPIDMGDGDYLEVCYSDSLLIIICALFVYGGAYFYYLSFSQYIVLLLYIFIFRYNVYKYLNSNEE